MYFSDSTPHFPLLVQRNTSFMSMENTSWTTASPYKQPFDHTAVIVSSAIVLPLSVIGIIANVITIIVIAQSPNLTSVFNYLMASLCASDLISATISPLLLYRRLWGFDEWVISSFMCKFYWGTDLWTSYVTSIHILLFALLRYVSVKSPSQYYKVRKAEMKKILAVVWILAFAVGFVPFAVMFSSKVRNRNGNTIDAKWPACTLDVLWLNDFRLYTAAAYSLFFYIPIIFVVLFSIAIVFLLYQKRKNRKSVISSCRGVISSRTLETKRRRQERQVTLQLALIVGSFLLGYLPHTAYHFFTTSFKPVTYHDKVVDWWFGMAEHICLRMSECLNPVFYNLASSNMRRETATLLRKLCCIKPERGTSQTSVLSQNLSKNLSTHVQPEAPGDQLEL